MFSFKITQFAFILGLCALALGSCQVADMRQHESLAHAASEQPVIGRKVLRPNKDFIIGKYMVQDVHRGWRVTNGFSLFKIKGSDTRQRFEFILRDSSGQESYVTCQAGLHSREIPLGKVFSVELGGENREIFHSRIASPESGTWELITKDPGPDVVFKSFSGALRKGDTEIQVHPVHEFQNRSWGPSSQILGYEFKAGPDVLAAVQVAGRGKFWLKKDLTADQRRVLTGAAAALLLYDKLNQSNTAEPQNSKIRIPVSAL